MEYKKNHKINAHTNLCNSSYLLNCRQSFCYKRNTKKRNKKRQRPDVKKDKIEKAGKPVAAKN